MDFEVWKFLLEHWKEIGVAGALTIILLYREYTNTKEKEKLHNMYQARIDKVFDKSLESQTKMIEILNEIKSNMNIQKDYIMLALNKKDDK